MKHSFSALGVSAAVEQALAVRGIVEPFYIQSLVLPDALAGRDVLAKSPTGSGKTLAFGVPLVERVNVDGATPEALVLVPTADAFTIIPVWQCRASPLYASVNDGNRVEPFAANGNINTANGANPDHAQCAPAEAGAGNRPLMLALQETVTATGAISGYPPNMTK